MAVTASAMGLFRAAREQHIAQHRNHPRASAAAQKRRAAAAMRRRAAQLTVNQPKARRTR